MKLTEAAGNRLADDFGFLLNAGALVLHEGTPPADSHDDPQPLAVVVLPPVAFQPAIDGRITSYPIDPIDVVGNGTARWARVHGADGVAAATLSVAAEGDEHALAADVVLNSTTLVRGGRLELSRVSLYLPLQPAVAVRGSFSCA